MMITKIYNHKYKENNFNISLIGIRIYILSLPLSIIPIFGLGSLYKYISILIASILVMDLLRRRKPYIYIPKPMIWWLVYTVYSFITLLWNDNISVGVNNTVSLLQILMISLLLVNKFEDKELSLIEDTWISMATILVISFFMFGGVQMSGYTERYTYSIFGSSEDPNQFSGYMIPAITLLVNRIIIKKSNAPKMILKLLLITMILYSVLLTGSRGGLIACSIAILIPILTQSKNNIRGSVKYIFLVIILAIVIYSIIFPLLPQSTLNRLTIGSIIGDGGSSRNIIWNTALIRFENSSVFHALFGYGVFGTAPNGNMHNQFIQVLNDGGIVGLLLYCGLLISFWKSFRKTNYAGAFYGFLALSMTITMYSYYKPYWTLLIIGAVLRVSNAKINQKA